MTVMHRNAPRHRALPGDLGALEPHRLRRVALTLRAQFGRTNPQILHAVRLTGHPADQPPAEGDQREGHIKPERPQVHCPDAAIHSSDGTSCRAEPSVQNTSARAMNGVRDSESNHGEPVGWRMLGGRHTQHRNRHQGHRNQDMSPHRQDRGAGRDGSITTARRPRWSGTGSSANTQISGGMATSRAITKSKPCSRWRTRDAPSPLPQPQPGARQLRSGTW